MKSIKVPHTLVLLFSMMIFAYALTWILPAGSFETSVDANGKELVVPGTYKVLEEQKNLPVWSVFTVIPRALGEAQGIIFFLFLIGGSIAVLRSTGAIDALLGKVLNRFSHQPAMLLFMAMLSFTLGSTSIGMAEEYIPLVLILISLCVALKMDTVSAVATMVVGYGIGYGTAIFNPFTVLVAQGVAGVTPTSGWEYRLILMVPLVAIGFHHVWKYARSVQLDPKNSLVYDVPDAQPPAASDYPELNGRRKAVLFATLGALILTVFGIAKFQWYFVELGAVFFVLGIITMLIAGKNVNETAQTFISGASELTGTALLIGFARSIELILTDGQVLHTVVAGLAEPLSYVGAELSAVGMLLIQSILNFFIPSGSGQAYVTMPLMAPIADLVGVSRQVAVLAYQMGDGLMNMIVPTNAVLMGILGMCGIPYDRWFRFVWPLVLKLLVASALALVIAVLIGYQ
ncbi:YfcC family protein [Pleionea sp. CnH1-48]|uniref:YfcC family protein n=1 Tax=Pleionea sp. CnH1-48 TaxID=2954494 RepID=UPI002096EF17|nr:TIGR00366 family protein [Pleionea sp. CnH1-48]MCO7223918.1 TIGR00366 family protein [Pleionea sp. CnH1-48]